MARKVDGRFVGWVVGEVGGSVGSCGRLGVVRLDFVIGLGSPAATPLAQLSLALSLFCQGGKDALTKQGQG